MTNAEIERYAKEMEALRAAAANTDVAIRSILRWIDHLPDATADQRIAKTVLRSTLDAWMGTP